MTRGIILIEPGSNCWIADFSKAHNERDVMDLFGTTKLPTPYRLTVPVATVVAAVQGRNPSDTVLGR